MGAVKASNVYRISYRRLLLLLLMVIPMALFGASSAQASNYLDDKILIAGESEMTRLFNDGTNSKSFDFRDFWSVPIRMKLQHMISLNDAKSSKAQQALNNLDNGEGYIVSTLKSYPGSPIQVAFYDPDAEVTFYNTGHPTASVYGYRAVASPYFYLMAISFSNLTTDKDVATYDEESLSRELFEKNAVPFWDYTDIVANPSSVNFLYSNYNYMYQRHFYVMAMNRVAYPSDYGGIEIPGPSKLDYLALGDSYSSGEGDTERKFDGSTYYLEGTDVAGDYNNGIPEEKCHISSRSYPFVLQASGVTGGDRIKSVACSGAKRVDVQGWSPLMGYGKEQKYQGQTNQVGALEIPRLEELSVDHLQDIARDNFIPGRVQQIEFVELFKPRAITLTIGGNDLGFGKILRACVSQVAIYGTCDYATEQGRKEAGSLIKNFRMQLVDVYSAIKKASPTSKLFVVGYPQFISSTQNFCGANSTLNRSDREFITESVTYLNQVIKSAAHQADAYYVNIEDALGEKILCTFTSDKYVNGLTAAFKDASEAFHPNKKGHAAIADHIKEGLKGQTLENFNDCAGNEIIICPGYGSSRSPDIPEYLNPPSIVDRIVKVADIVRDTGNNIATSLSKGVEYVVRLSPLSLQPTMIVNISLHSESVDLGRFEVAEDGSLDAKVVIPDDVPAGYHTLYVEGKTYSGEDVAFRQIVQVYGNNPADIDENNVPDIQQPCGPFMVASETDADLDGVDDACDPYISENPQLYRWRFGDSKRIYGDGPENENQLYIERNVWASRLTGVAGDYDPDSDGWAVVGVSKDDQLDGANNSAADTNISFEVLGDGSQGAPYSPIVYIHPNTQQCRAYQPLSLSRVEEGELRTLAIAEISNEKCPQELPDDDIPEQPASDPPWSGAVLLSKLEKVVSTVKEQIKIAVNIITSLVRALSSLFG